MGKRNGAIDEGNMEPSGDDRWSLGEIGWSEEGGEALSIRDWCCCSRECGEWEVIDDFEEPLREEINGEMRFGGKWFRDCSRLWLRSLEDRDRFRDLAIGGEC